MAPHDRPSLSARLALALALTLFALPGASAAGGPLDPLEFVSLGTLTLANDSFTIDTDALEIRDGSSMLLFTGVVDDQGGSADYLNNVWVPASNGIPEIAVFAFDNIDLQSSATITVLGSRALALLARGSASIDTTIDLSPPDLIIPASPFTPPAVPSTVGFAGGFNGGPLNAPGDGPGGGLTATATPQGGGPAGFGGPGRQQGVAFAGSAYGDIAFGPLQGGSGGSAFATFTGAAAGGGALEISAAGSVTLGPSGSLVAAGGKVIDDNGSSFPVGGGPGSGGGIRLSGAAVTLLGTVDAGAFRFDSASNWAGGGRVAVFGYNQLPEFVVGGTTPGVIDTSMIDVDGGQFFVTNHFADSGEDTTRGVITVTPQITTIPFGQTFTLGEITDLSDANRNLFLVHQDLRVSDGGAVAVPAGGIAQSGRIELFPPTASITGVDPLTNRGEITGSGVIAVDLTNEAGGTVNAVKDALSFTNAVVNAAGAQINAIGSTLDFQGGLTNNAGSQLNLINTTVSGSVASVATAGVMIAGTVTFGGEVSGTADFGGTGTTVFQGSYRPGASPGWVSFGGDVVFDAGSTLFAEIGGLLPGFEHDRIDVSGDAIFDGALDLSLVGGFTPIAGQVLTLLTHASAAGEFASIAGVSAGALDLAVAYGATGLTVTAALRGDVNLDGAVTNADRVLVEQNLGFFTTAYSSGDVNGSGSVDTADLDIVLEALGAGATAVPALPASGLVLLIVTLSLTALRYGVATSACSHRAP